MQSDLLLYRDIIVIDRIRTQQGIEILNHLIQCSGKSLLSPELLGRLIQARTTLEDMQLDLTKHKERVEGELLWSTNVPSSLRARTMLPPSPEAVHKRR